MIASGRRTPAQSSGADAEQAAENCLVRGGLEIVARNYRTRFGEIDLIARDGETLVFVEVRLRSSDRFGGAAASIDAHKRARIVSAARQYLSRLGRNPPCRFDVVTLDGGSPTWM
ncbi:MAG TPA: YraN family protein, partial [Usitatibacter sp.]